MVELRGTSRRLQGTESYQNITRNLGDREDGEYPFEHGFEAFTASLVHGLQSGRNTLVSEGENRDDSSEKGVEMTSVGQLRDTQPEYAYTIEMCDRIIAATLAKDRGEKFTKNTPDSSEVWDLVIFIANQGADDLSVQWEENSELSIKEDMDNIEEFWETALDEIGDVFFAAQNRGDALGYES